MEREEDSDELTTLSTAETPFAAHTIVMVLENAGIEAIALDAIQGGIGLPLNKARGVPIQVRRSDLDRAKAALEANTADSVDIDWDEVDLGEREDNLPLNTPGRVPPLVWVALGAMALLLLAALISGLPALTM